MSIEWRSTSTNRGIKGALQVVPLIMSGGKGLIALDVQ